MALPRAFKTDESFLEKIAMGAIGTRRTFEDLERQGHRPMELERGSMSFKIWKAIKIKRVRVPDPEDARQWVAYIVGTQGKDVMLPGIEELANRDPQVYFAVTVLWKILASWVYGLEEY